MDVGVIKSVVGRWALLDNGDWVTPVDSFADFAYNEANFGRAIAAFQGDPYAALSRRIADRIPARAAPSAADGEADTL